MTSKLGANLEEEKETPYLAKNAEMVQNIAKGVAGTDNPTLFNMYTGK